MKKSFMTRVLAMGLSFAMAFSLSAATNVTTASAAAKKVGVTTMMKVPTKSVVEGKTVKTYMNGTALEKYRIKKVAKLSAVADKYIDVDVITTGKRPRQGIKITAHEGAVTAAKLTKKGVYVTIYFAETTSAKKAATAPAKKYAKLKVAVQAKPVEKLTMTAAATKVKQITVTFNKAVDTTTTKIVVKKASATPTITTTFAADGKSAEIAMGTKLTEGTYTVEATVGEEVLTADIAVQDEKLDTFELVNKNLVATAASKAAATISYKALNQYGEMMPADSVSKPTCSFGNVTDHVTPTADKTGKIEVTGIPEVLAVDGQTGTLVIVDSQTGTTLNETVTYRSKAVASKATVYGIYDTKKEKLVEGNLKVGATIADYKLLVNIQDQYEADMTPKNICDSDCEVSFNPASVLTDVTLTKTKIASTGDDAISDPEEITYDEKSCFLMPLKVTTTTPNTTKVKDAGTLNLTLVSANKGVLATPSFTIDDSVLIKTLNVTSKDTVYSGQENELVVEAIDADGNAVTKYDDLKASIQAQDGIPADVVLKKNSDGTGTFWYTPATITGSTNDKFKKNELKTLIFKANDPASGQMIVKTVNMNVYAKRQAWKVSGTTADTVVATEATTGSSLNIKLKTLTYEDQYSNTLKYTDDQVKNNVTSCSAFIVDKDGIFGYDATGSAIAQTTVSGDKVFAVTAAGIKKGSATLYLKWSNALDAATASAVKYDLKMTISTVDISGVTADNLKLVVNDGNAIYGEGQVEVTKAAVKTVATTDSTGVTASAVVMGTVGGKTVVIPTEKWTITTNAKVGSYGAITSTNPAKTETKTVTVVVESTEGPQTITADVTVSNEKSAPKTIKANDTKDISIASGTAITASALYGTIEVKDQYGVKLTNKASDIQYTVTFTGSNAEEAQKKASYNATQDVTFTLDKGNYAATVKYVLGTIEFTQNIKIDINDH